MRTREAEFAELISKETGKPLWEAKTEVGAVVNKVQISIQAYAERTPQRKMEAAMGDRIAVRHKPHGVLAVLGPYNFPAHLPNGHIVPALIAGNAVVFKPSEKTPAVGEFLVRCFHESGIPEGVIRLLIGGPDQGRALAGATGHRRASVHRLGARRRLDLQAVRRNAAENPRARARRQQPARRLEREGHRSGGDGRGPVRLPHRRPALHGRPPPHRRGRQGSRFSQRPIEADGPPGGRPAVRRSAALHGSGDRQSSAGLVQEQWVNLMMKGGKPIRQLQRKDDEKPYLTPALIDMTDAKERPDEEIFGPVLQLIRVKDFDAAIDEANSTRFGLAASLVGGSPEMYDKFWANVRAGVINWNKPTNGAPSNAPFGGVGLSGNHRPSAFYAADYCAYPVTSSEAEIARGAIGQGLRDPNMKED